MKTFVVQRFPSRPSLPRLPVPLSGRPSGLSQSSSSLAEIPRAAGQVAGCHIRVTDGRAGEGDTEDVKEQNPAQVSDSMLCSLWMPVPCQVLWGT